MYSKIRVEVIYVLPYQKYSQLLFLPSGSTIEQAIHFSSILEICKDIDLKNNKVGIFNKIYPLNHKLIDGDRVEIYRPLIINPMDLRRKRANNFSKR